MMPCFYDKTLESAMYGSSSWFYSLAPGALRAAAMAAFALGAGVWGAVLLAPVPSRNPPLLAAELPQQQSVQPLAQWFGGRPLRVRVSVTGIIAAEDGRGAALLSIDGAPVRAFRVGQSLAPGVILQAVSSNTVSIAQDGELEQFSAPAGPGSGLRGFVPAQSAN